MTKENLLHRVDAALSRARLQQPEADVLWELSMNALKQRLFEARWDRRALGFALIKARKQLEEKDPDALIEKRMRDRITRLEESYAKHIAEKSVAKLEIETLKSIIDLAIRFRKTPIVDDDFAELRDRFDVALAHYQKHYKAEQKS